MHSASSGVPAQQVGQLGDVCGDAAGFVLGENSISPVEQIDFHFEAVRRMPPVSHPAAALVPTFCSLYGTFGARCATDHNALLEALSWMTIEPSRLLKKITR
jgi:hypothetical protein